jgi:hypothetical protein
MPRATVGIELLVRGTDRQNKINIFAYFKLRIKPRVLAMCNKLVKRMRKESRGAMFSSTDR